MSATLQTTRSAVLAKTAVPFLVQGTAMDPVFRPDLGALTRSQANAVLQSEAQKRLKALMELTVPGYLGSDDAFTERYIRPLEADPRGRAARTGGADAGAGGFRGPG
jgi:hypothetical protein